MNTIPYTIWRYDFRTFEGSNEQWDVGVRAKAKHSADNPLEVAHELLALRLGLILGLPIPNGIPLVNEGPKKYWGSLTVTKEKLPRLTRRHLAAILSNEKLACGIIAFDSWILNQDRFDKNISYDAGRERTYIFDHGRAFGAGQKQLLEKNVNNIGIGSHCLAGDSATVVL
jgi:hypothetical protein